MTLTDHLVFLGLTTVLLVNSDHLCRIWTLTAHVVVVLQLRSFLFANLLIEEAEKVEDAFFKNSLFISWLRLVH